MNRYCFSILLLAGFLASCASMEPTRSTSPDVKVITGSAPKGCKFLGNVTIAQTEIYGPSHKDKEQEQLNNLKNQASQLGANVIVLRSHQTRYFPHPKYIIETGKSQRELDAHAMSGKAYRCSYGSTKIRDENISDVQPIDE